MGNDGIEATGLEFATERILDDTPRRRCQVVGCGCADSRIVSPRRGRFHAYLARVRGETADRVIGPDVAWRLPSGISKEL